MVAFTYRMPAGIPGTINRTEMATVEAQFIDTATPPGAYGLPVKFASGKIQAVGSGDAAAAIVGFLARVYPGPMSNDPLGTSTPVSTAFPSTGECNVLKRGYMIVLLSSGSVAAAKGGIVYIRVAAAASGKPLGGIEAASDSTNTIVVPNTYFTGAADANGITEIAYNI